MTIIHPISRISLNSKPFCTSFSLFWLMLRDWFRRNEALMKGIKSGGTIWRWFLDWGSEGCFLKMSTALFKGMIRWHKLRRRDVTRARAWSSLKVWERQDVSLKWVNFFLDHTLKKIQQIGMKKDVRFWQFHPHRDSIRLSSYFHISRNLMKK